MARVVFTDQAREDFRELDGDVRRRVAKKLKELESEPDQRGQPLGSRATGNLAGLRKLVVGNRQHRIVYKVEADGTVVVIWVIASRVDDACYEMALARIDLYDDPARKAQLRELVAGVRDTASRPHS